MSSSSGIVEISRSRTRYKNRDFLLMGFVCHDGFTAKEVAVEVLGWSNEKYSNSPKRAHDLFLLDYLSRGDTRECRQTGKQAHTFSITKKGIGYLREKGFDVGFVPPVVAPVVVDAGRDVGRERLRGLRDLLGA